MSFMNKFERDSIYEEMEGTSKSTGSNIAGKITTSILLLAIGFSSGSIYSTFNSNKNITNENNVQSEITNKNSILTTSNQITTNTPTILSADTTSHSIKGIVKSCADSVVEIKIETTSSFLSYEYTSEGNGSGVIISEDGYILTNNHVIEGAKKIFVSLRDGTEYEAKLIGRDSKTDTAVIKVEATGLKFAILGDSSLLEVGDLAVVIGNPLGELGGTVTSGIISALEREIEIDGKSMNLIQTDAGVNPGNSGVDYLMQMVN